ncbi:F-box/kelch-repeat protein-like protein [Tanacetum coccineum]
MHNRKKDYHQEDHKLFFISYYSPHEFFTVNCEAPRNKVPFSRPLPRFDNIGAVKIRIITSAHGLVCLWVHPDIILWNPLTTEYKKLPRMDNKDWYLLGNGGLYYSSCEDDYKLVLVTDYHGTVYVYSLKSDSWRMVNNGAIKVDGRCWKSYVFLNDSLYFLSENEQKPYSIIRFDTMAESFQKIETPSVNKPHSATITVHGGYVHYCVKYDIGRLKSTCIELWKLNADGDMREKVVTYELRPNDIRFLSPLHLMRNGNWLMIEQ